MDPLLQSFTLELYVAIAAVIVGLTALDDLIAALVSRIPGVGPILAPILRRLSARGREWLRTKVPASAEAAVKQAEGHVGDGHGGLKKEQAVATLRAAEPGLTDGELEREVQAAFDRLLGANNLEKAPQ